MPLSQVEERFAPRARLMLADGRSFTVRASRPHHHRLLVWFEEVGDREAAEALRGEYLFVPAEDAPELPEGEYWPHQLLGCEVVTEEGRVLGTITDIVRSQANDVWVAAGPEGEVLVPALREVVVSVDVRERRVVVREVPGLIEP